MPDPQRTGRLNKSRSKRIEREVAATVGRTRNRETGDRTADVYCGPFDIEVKSRLGFKELQKLMDEAVAKARGGQFPVLALVLREPGHPNISLAIQPLEQWAQWNASRLPPPNTTTERWWDRPPASEEPA